MNEHRRERRRAWRLAGLLLVIGVTFGAQAAPPTLKLPGRKPDSMEPWGPFLGRSAHLVIGKQYRIQNPTHVVFIDTVELYEIVKRAGLGNPKLLPEFTRRLRPDITDVQALVLFEIKPDHDEGLKQGREQASRYLAALNTVIEPGKQLAGGNGFEGALFLEFENGGALWQLSWHTPEPGVTLYRWSYRRKRRGASWQERAAQREEELPKKEMESLGELAEQAIRAAYEGSEAPSGFQGQVYLPVDCP